MGDVACREGTGTIMPDDSAFFFFLGGGGQRVAGSARCPTSLRASGYDGS